MCIEYHHPRGKRKKLGALETTSTIYQGKQTFAQYAEDYILRLFHKARMPQYLHSVLLRWTGRSRVGGKEICCCLLALSLKITYDVICRRRQ